VSNDRIPIHPDRLDELLLGIHDAQIRDSEVRQLVECYRAHRLWVAESHEDHDQAWLTLRGPEGQGAAFAVPKDSIRAVVLRQFAARQGDA
jgi:hypothetical protein